MSRRAQWAILSLRELFPDVGREGGHKMKAGIHPQYVPAMITCACGEVIHTRSTVPVQRVEICSKCHPLFTGRQKLIDSEGRVERFQRKYGRKPLASQVPGAEA